MAPRLMVCDGCCCGRLEKGKFDLEIVSHCWGYANMLTYQLSSFVNYPPTKLNLTVTVFYAEEDTSGESSFNFSLSFINITI